jgi:hypothetical protein
MIAALQVKANGKVIVDSTGSRIDSRMAYRGLTQSATFLPVDFTEVRGRTKNALLSGGFDTTFGNGTRNLRMEVTIAGATTPTLAGWAAVSPPMAEAEFQGIRPLVARVHNVSQTIGAAGTFPLQIPHFDPAVGGSLFKRIVWASANMTALQIVRNGIIEHDSIAAVNNFRQQYEGLRTPQASYYVYDPIIDNFQEGRVLDTRQAAGCSSAIAYGTFSAGETIVCEAETLEPLDVY